MLFKKGEVYQMMHSRKGDLKVRIAEDSPDSNEWVSVEILEGKAIFISQSYNLAQKIEGLGTEGTLLDVRKSLATWKLIEHP